MPAYHRYIINSTMRLPVLAGTPPSLPAGSATRCRPQYRQDRERTGADVTQVSKPRGPDLARTEMPLPLGAVIAAVPVLYLQLATSQGTPFAAVPGLRPFISASSDPSFCATDSAVLANYASRVYRRRRATPCCIGIPFARKRKFFWSNEQEAWKLRRLQSWKSAPEKIPYLN